MNVNRTFVQVSDIQKIVSRYYISSSPDYYTGYCGLCMEFEQ